AGEIDRVQLRHDGESVGDRELAAKQEYWPGWHYSLGPPAPSVERVCRAAVGEHQEQHNPEHEVGVIGVGLLIEHLMVADQRGEYATRPAGVPPYGERDRRHGP